MNNVRAVLSASQWNALRGKIADAAWNVCQICGGVGPNHPVECHEIWEYNEKTKIQRLAGMIALCPDCHMVKHFGYARVTGKEEQAFKHFMKINELKKKEAETAISQAYEVWRKRSLIDWELDLSGLKRYGIDVSKLRKPSMKPIETE